MTPSKGYELRLTRVADVGREGRVAGESGHHPLQIRLDDAL